jgi:hypothetical protein
MFTADSVVCRAYLEDGVPSPLMTWVEERYAVVEFRRNVPDMETGPQEAITLARAELARCGSCQPKENVGIAGKGHNPIYLL